VSDVWTHCGKFSQAISDLSFGKYVDPEWREFGLAVAQSLITAQRFYLPGAAWVLTGKEIDEEVKNLIRLPFDTIAILTETQFNDTDLGKTDSWMITLACEIRKRIDVGSSVLARRGFSLASLALIPDPDGGRDFWFLQPISVFCELPENISGFVLHPHVLPMRTTTMQALEEAGIRTWGKELIDDASSVMNLCALLGLHNVETIEQNAPAKVQKKRSAGGKSPLYSYHVLSVDGEIWDKSMRLPSNGGEGLRSHLRRGHIRRLDSGRRVWVRAAYVHGRKPGFVDKDYLLTPRGNA